MKKLLMLLAGTLAISSVGLVSCKDSGDADKQNTLRVRPAADILFKADGNEDVVLTIETDAKAWNFEADEWITTKQDGNTLIVNAQVNMDETPRSGRIAFSAGNAQPLRINVKQEAAEEIVLGVEPSDPIAFEAAGNKVVELTVTTNAADWTFTYPEDWMTAEKSGDKLTVNATDNEGDARVGKIVVTTVGGEKSVEIEVSQKACDIPGSLSTEDETTFEFPAEEAEAVKKVLTFTLAKAAATDVQVEVRFNEARVEEYNTAHETEYEAFPVEALTIADEGLMTIKAGETVASIEVTVNPSEELIVGTTYMIPLQAEVKTEGIIVEDDAQYVDLFVSKAAKEDPISGSLSMTDAPEIKFPAENAEAVKKELTFTLEKAAAEDVQVEVRFQADRVGDYNTEHETEYLAFPVESLTIAGEGIMTIGAGKTSATLEVTVNPGADLVAGKTYMIPLQAVSKSGDVIVNKEAQYVDLFVTKEEPQQEVYTLTMTTSDPTNINFSAYETLSQRLKVTYTLDKPAPEAMKFQIIVDEARVNEYNSANGTSYGVYPGDIKGTISNLPYTATISKGSKSGSTYISVYPSSESGSFMAPLKAVPQTAGLVAKDGAQYIDLFISKEAPIGGGDGKIHNICYFEVNDCNPLNALEYLLEDGTPFFDAVVLFAGNINWDAQKGKVYMHANPNVQALLDGSNTYLQPLRQKGIKVLLCILGNHDASGVAGLTDYGCEQFGRELAQICRDYQLDGIAFDDEYSNYGSMSNDWITFPAAARAARLCYETKKSLKELCSWETWVHLYYLNNIKSSLPSVTVNGKTIMPGEFIDNVCEDYYNGPAKPVMGMGLSGCAAASIQLNNGMSMDGPTAKSYMDQGYGWLMWFAFDPSGTGTVSSNRTHALQQFRNVAQSCYGQSVQDPKNVYNKKGEGWYDPTPHPIN
ncbi:BT_3987 domain-containing protein [Alistipes putredinis]|uniref:BT_3987 domain-containing protein n=1 Tax=Alistipes putredinis TaxID=28117 RepID=UPI003AB63648